MENFIPEDQFWQLRTRLTPSKLIFLGHLSRQETEGFFRRLNEERHFYWTEGGIRSLSEITGGYPFRMNEALRRNLKRYEIKDAPAGFSPAKAKLNGSNRKPKS